MLLLVTVRRELEEGSSADRAYLAVGVMVVSMDCLREPNLPLKM